MLLFSATRHWLQTSRGTKKTPHTVVSHTNAQYLSFVAAWVWWKQIFNSCCFHHCTALCFLFSCKDSSFPANGNNVLILLIHATTHKCSDYVVQNQIPVSFMSAARTSIQFPSKKQGALQQSLWRIKTWKRQWKNIWYIYIHFYRVWKVDLDI